MNNTKLYVKDKDSSQEINAYVREYEKREPTVKVITNGVILPVRHTSGADLGGVFDGEGIFVKESGMKNPWDLEQYVFGGEYKYDSNRIKNVDETVVFIGKVFPHWGHFLMDFCTRLWYCIDHPDLRIACCGDGFASVEDLPDEYRTFFRLLKIDLGNIINIKKITRFKKVIVPEQAFQRNEYYSDAYKRMISVLCSNVDSAGMHPYKKIYFTRNVFRKSKRNWHREYGEKAIERTIEKNGFKILNPSGMSLEEQVFYVRNARCFAVIPGGASANAIFASEQTERIYVRKGFMMIPDMPQIDLMNRASKVTYVMSA